MENVGPRKMSNMLMIGKLFAGLLGGFGGTLTILLIIFATNTFGETMNFSLFVILMIAILGSLSSNILAIMFFAFFDSERYTNLPKILSQTFAFNIVFTICITPLYFIAQQSQGGEGIDQVMLLLTFHLSLSSFMTYFIAESISNSNHFLIIVYGAALSLLILLAIHFFILSSLETETFQTISLISSLPITWGVIGFFGSLVEMIYGAFYNIYGIDFLSNNLNLYQEDSDATEE
jgi:hypothetical protein